MYEGSWSSGAFYHIGISYHIGAYKDLFGASWGILGHVGASWHIGAFCSDLWTSWDLLRPFRAFWQQSISCSQYQISQHDFRNNHKRDFATYILPKARNDSDMYILP